MGSGAGLATLARGEPRTGASRPGTRSQSARAPAPPRLEYVPAFDGLRAVSVVAVLLFHAGLDWIPGGFLGVDAFFVLSGFLISSILLGELGSSGRISFGRFYSGRVRRLLPALVAVLLFSAALAVLFAQDAAARVREDSIAALFYVTNWWNVVNDQSYFDATGRPPMLQHLWSLAVEEQFYLIWPAVALLSFRRWGRGGVRRVALGGVAASTLAMLVLGITMGMPGDHDPSRLYFGSDTHSMGVLLGAALATVWRPDRLPKTLAFRPRAVLAAAGGAALVGMGAFFCLIDEGSGFLYRGGFLAFSALTAVAIAVASHPALRAFRWLGWQPLRYIGTRSYGLYLWHWPVFMVLRPGIDIDWTGAPAIVAQLVVTGVLAELSYRFLEMPVRRGAVGRLWRRWRAGEFSLTTRPALAAQAVAGVAAVAMGIVLWSIPAPSADDYLGGVTEVGSGLLTPEPGGALAPSSPGVAPLPLTPGPGLAKVPITAVGDSVMLGARSELTKALPKVTVDAAISRQAEGVAHRIADRRKAGQLSDIVVIHTGTNGPAYVSILRPMLDQLADRYRVVLVTNRGPEKWIEQSNNAIAGVARDYANTRVADWAAVAGDRRDFFYADGTHTTPAGAQAYAQMIVAAVTGA